MKQLSDSLSRRAALPNRGSRMVQPENEVIDSPYSPMHGVACWQPLTTRGTYFGTLEASWSSVSKSAAASESFAAKPLFVPVLLLRPSEEFQSPIVEFSRQKLSSASLIPGRRARARISFCKSIQACSASFCVRQTAALTALEDISSTISRSYWRLREYAARGRLSDACTRP